MVGQTQTYLKTDYFYQKPFSLGAEQDRYSNNSDHCHIHGKKKN